MKAKQLSFVFISFSESGLFNGLQPIQIKKSFRISTRVPGCMRERHKRIIAVDFSLHPACCSGSRDGCAFPATKTR
jgi:hypothetical protein